MDKVFKALTDPSRRKILEILREGDMTVSEIAEHFSFSGASLSHHLNILVGARLVVNERRGKYIIYSLNTSVFEEMMATFVQLFGKKGKMYE